MKKQYTSLCECNFKKNNLFFQIFFDFHLQNKKTKTKKAKKINITQRIFLFS